MTLPHRKFKEKLEKLDKLLRQFPHGAKATELAKKLGIGRSSIYDYLNSLESQGKACTEHSLWYPRNSGGTEPKQHELTQEEYLTWEKKRVREDRVNGYIDRAYTRARLLIDEGKVSKQWYEKNGLLLMSIDAEFKAISRNSIEQFNPDRQRRIRKLKLEIVDEALKSWF